MKARWIVVTVGIAMMLAVGGLCTAQTEPAEKEKKFEATCPVSGKPAVEKSVVELPQGGGKVYFCCDNCPKAYKADPKKFQLAVHRQFLETGQVVQVACPVSGKPINPKELVEYKGEKVYFCCPNCPAAFEANPAKFVAKLPQLARDEAETQTQ